MIQLLSPHNYTQLELSAILFGMFSIVCLVDIIFDNKLGENI